MPKILFKSDVHYHNYANGITLADIVDIDEQFYNLCLSEQPDIIVDCGDRFVSRNPNYEVLVAADTSMHKLAGLHIPIIFLAGNHDCVFKSHLKVNTIKHLDSYVEFDNLSILDTKRTHIQYVHDGPKDTRVAFHAIPAGFDTKNTFTDFSCDFNICIFHGTIDGSLYMGDIVAEGHAPASDFECKEYDVVICGDNHKPQKIDCITQVDAYYVGAPAQHNWGDAGSKRGFLMLTLEKGKRPEVSRFNTRYPLFIKDAVNIASEADLVSHIQANISTYIGNIIKLTMCGTHDVLSAINTKQWRDTLISAGVRSISIHTDIYRSDSTTVQRHVETDAESWVSFAAMKRVELPSDIDLDKMVEIGSRYIND